MLLPPEASLLRSGVVPPAVSSLKLVVSLDRRPRRIISNPAPPALDGEVASSVEEVVEDRDDLECGEWTGLQADFDRITLLGTRILLLSQLPLPPPLAEAEW